MQKLNKGAAIFGIIFLVLAVIFTYQLLSTYFGFTLQTNFAYQREFGEHVTMAYDQADFTGIQTELMIIWTKMNETFAGADYAHTYCAVNFYPWENNRVFSNSLKAQNDYFNRLNNSLNYNIQCKYNATFRPFMWDEYKALNDTRNEMKREGGLDWALHGCWCELHSPSYLMVGYYYIWWLLGAIASWILAIGGLLGTFAFA